MALQQNVIDTLTKAANSLNTERQAKETAILEYPRSLLTSQGFFDKISQYHGFESFFDNEYISALLTLCADKTFSETEFDQVDEYIYKLSSDVRLKVYDFQRQSKESNLREARVSLGFILAGFIFLTHCSGFDQACDRYIRVTVDAISNVGLKDSMPEID